MKVRVAPIFRGNPYQRKLHEALTDLGVQIVRERQILTITDVLHMHWLHPYMLGGSHLPFRVGRLARMLTSAKARNKPLIWTVHNLADHQARHPWADKALNRLIASNATTMVVHGPHAKARLLDKWPKANIAIMEHPGYQGCYPVPTPNHGRRRLGIGNEETVFGMVGNLTEYKGVRVLVNAFRALPKLNARLLLAGAPETPELGQWLAEQDHQDPRICYVPGRVSDDDLPAYCEAIDAMMLTYKASLTSGSALLAMTYGCAILGPKIGALMDATDKAGSMLYNLGEHADDKTHQQAIQQVLTHATARPHALNGLKAHNRARAARQTWARAAGQLLDIYQRPVGDRRS